MDQKSKAKLVKSKSSNSAITSRSEKGSSNKKSRSNVEFKALAGKKRGVYVEKRPSGSKHGNTEDKNETQSKLKAPPRSRPGTKTFLASVLTILSKSTASTQYPPIHDPKDVKQRSKQRKLLKQTPESQRSKMLKNSSLKNDPNPNDEITIKKFEDYQETSTKTKKTKYKSRVLNEVSMKPSQKVLVLQSKKDIVQTPSCNSKSTKEMSEHSIKWADFLPKLIDSETGAVKNVLEKNYDPQEHGIAKSVLEGTQYNLDKKANDPTTLVSTPPKDEKLYSLFVDLLETVYNVNPEYNAFSGLKSVMSSKIQLEIDDSVAQKLDEPNKNPDTIEDDHHIAPKQHYSVTPDDNEDWDTQKLAEYFRNKPISVEWSEPYLQTKKTCKCVRKKLKTDPYAMKKKVAAKTQSAIMEERKSFYKKTKKLDLLNILKQQLKMDDGGREDTDNFYQALRIIARNKRKQNTIRFDTSVKGGRNAGSDYDSCIFKRRKVISPSTRLPKRPKGNRASDFFRIPLETKSEDSEYTRTMAESTIHCNESNHSLEVTGFDYEPRTGLPGIKSSVYTNSASESEFEDDSKITNWNLGFRTMTQQWNP